MTSFYFFLRFYLFIHERHRESESEREREREREAETQAEGEADCIHAGSPMWDSIPGPWDHALDVRAGAKLLSHPSIPQLIDIESTICQALF